MADLAQKRYPGAVVSKVGIPGNNQQGIDLYVLEPGREKGTFIQCKRHEHAKPGLIGRAVQRFLDSEYGG